MDAAPEDQPWYVKDLTNLEPDTPELFEKYAKVPPDDVASHIKQCRDKAFKVYPYPCLGHWDFLGLNLSQSPHYAEVLQRLKDGDSFLDIGCCVGQDIRKLVYDGAPSEHTFGSDLHQLFLDIGYDLFLDKSTLKTTFIAADVLDPNSDLKQLEGKIDIVNAALFLHLFDWEGQVQAAKKITALTKPKSGCLIVGRQLGNTNAGDALSHKLNRKRFRHNEESFKKLWKQVGDETGTEWKVEAHLVGEAQNEAERSLFGSDLIPAGTKMLNFIVRKL